MKRFPTWLRIALPVVLLLGLAFAALVKVLLEEPPEYARAPEIQARFAEQIDLLLELARTNPSDGCFDHDAPEDMVQEVDRMKPWWEKVDQVRDRFADPAIVDAEVVYYCDRLGFATTSFGLKNYQEPVGSWSRSLFVPAGQFPSVSLWRDRPPWVGGVRQLVRYEDRLPGSEGAPRGIRLVLDVQSLGPSSSPDVAGDVP